MEQFWRLTLRELDIVLAGEADRQFHRQSLAFYTAYYAGLLSQPYGKNKFPAYDKLAPRRNDRHKRTASQSRVEAIAAITAWHAMVNAR